LVESSLSTDLFSHNKDQHILKKSKNRWNIILFAAQYILDIFIAFIFYTFLKLTGVLHILLPIFFTFFDI